MPWEAVKIGTNLRQIRVYTLKGSRIDQINHTLAETF